VSNFAFPRALCVVAEAHADLLAAQRGSAGRPAAPRPDDTLDA
jgi:hypothetical protein